MKFKFLAAALVAALLTGVVSADPPKAFEVTPGFQVEKGFTVAPPMRVPMAPEPKAKEKCADCVDCKCPPGKCPDCAAPVANADPLWFACRVIVDRGGGVGASGSGTPISCENGKTVIVTNAHVVPKHQADRPIKVQVSGREFAAKYIDGSEVEEYLGPQGEHMVRVLGPDLALLSIDAEIGHVELADEPAPVGVQVWQFGYGGQNLGAGPTLKSGTVVRSNHVEPTLVSTIDTISGDSGSGVFNTRGELVGVTWGGASDRTAACAVELGTVRKFAGRPLAARLFPRLAARAEAKRAARELAALPPASAKPPVVERKGPIDPKLAKPGVNAPKPATPPASPPKATPAVPQAPFGSGVPPAPAGEGWQWDAQRRVWWKFADGGVSGGNCPNGKCPTATPGVSNPFPSTPYYGNGRRR
jgi:hypothetical protein